MSPIILYDYWRSSACYRVRIALNLKGVEYEKRPVNLAESEQRSDEYRALNPEGLACDIHPLNNLRILKYLKNELGHSQEEVDRWYVHWIREGLPALEAIAAPKAGKFLFGEMPTAADVFLVPQLYNARRFNVPIDDFPTLLRAEENANKLEAFAAAHPERQEQPA
jgi:glutathione S-transferase